MLDRWCFRRFHRLARTNGASLSQDSASKSHSGGEDSVRKTQQKRARPLQESAIYDAIRALKPGATAESIASFIEVSRLPMRCVPAYGSMASRHRRRTSPLPSLEQQKKQETPPPDFRKQLAHQLRLLADAGKIVKVKNLFFVAGEMPKKTAPVVRLTSAPFTLDAEANGALGVPTVVLSSMHCCRPPQRPARS